MKNKGFTLIELLVVISIITLLSSIIFSFVRESREKARLTTLKETVRNLAVEAELYFLQNNQYASATLSTEVCPSVVTNNWGFFGSQKGQELIKAIARLSGTTGPSTYCAISKDSWAFNVNVTNLVAQGTLINTAYANSVSGYICFDSSGNKIVNNFNLGSDGQARLDQDVITISPSGKFVCN